jgi:hypothetical protein
MAVRISIEASRKDLEPAVDWIGGLVGGVLDQRVASLQQQERRNPLLAAHFRETYALEFALAAARKYRKSTGRLPKVGEGYDALFGFLVPAHRIHRTLPSQAIKAFEGRLTTVASSPHGIRPFAYELGIATHLMSKNWDVEFADYGGLANFDFLAYQNSLEIEVECEATSGDTGRKIHRQEVNRLADLILPCVQRLGAHPGCHLLRITIPDRLGKSNEELSGIAATVATAVERQQSATTECAIVDCITTDLTSWPEPNGDTDCRQFFERQFGLQNTHLLLLSNPRVSIVGVTVVSSKREIASSKDLRTRPRRQPTNAAEHDPRWSLCISLIN